RQANVAAGAHHFYFHHHYHPSGQGPARKDTIGPIEMSRDEFAMFQKKSRTESLFEDPTIQNLMGQMYPESEMKQFKMSSPAIATHAFRGMAIPDPDDPEIPEPRIPTDAEYQRLLRQWPRA